MDDSIHEDSNKIGIYKVIKFGKIKQNTYEQAIERAEVLKIESDTNSSIIKIEFSLTSCFILLTNGRVFSKGKIKDVTIGREANIETVKKFKQIIFNDEKKLDDIHEIYMYNISAGEEHILSLDNQMRLWGWGKNDKKQLNPKSKLDEIKIPQLIAVPQEAKIIQIFTLNSSSMIVCRGGLIYIWGSNKEKFIGDLSSAQTSQQGNKVDIKYALDFVKMDKLSNIITYDTRKNDKSFLEGYINSRKLLNSKFNISLDDNSNKNYRVEKLNVQINALKNEIRKHNSANINSFATKLKSNDKKILILQELLETYENNLSSLTIQKEALRKELISIEAEINKKSVDLKSNSTQIELVEDQIEELINDINTMKFKISTGENIRNYQEMISEKTTKINNLNIYKDSLSTNLQIIIIFLESKDKEKYEKAKQISEIVSKENEYLKTKFILEDMIHIINESNNYSNYQTDELNDKEKEKYIEFFNFCDQIENLTFLKLHKKYPYMIISDIISISEGNLNQVKTEYDLLKQNLSENMKEKLNVILNMIDTKYELTTEQNNLIRCLYSFFNNLESEIKKKADEMDKDSFKMFSDNKGKHIEYVYKELIINYLKEVYKQDDLPMILPNKDELEKITEEKEKYLKEKQDEVKLLESRELIEKIDSKINFEDLVCFDYDEKV